MIPTMARIGIFGGSFNPVHAGHVIMALRACECARLHQMLLVPAATPPHKEPASLLPASLRTELLRLAFKDIDRCEVDEREIMRGEVSYTVETLEEIHRDRPEDELFFLLGADSLAQLPTWRRIERLAELATFLWIRRPGVPEEAALHSVASIPSLRLEPVDAPVIQIASSDIRARLAAGLSIRGLVPDAVEERLRNWATPASS